MDIELDTTIKLAKQLAKNSRFVEALELLDKNVKSAAVHPRVWKLWVCRAYVNDCRGDQASAVKDITRAIVLAPTEPDNVFTRGRYFLQLGRYDEAVEDFTITLRLCDTFNCDYYRAPAHFARADALIRLREYERAQDDLSNVPDGHRAWTDTVRTKEELLALCLRGSDAPQF